MSLKAIEQVSFSSDNPKYPYLKVGVLPHWKIHCSWLPKCYSIQIEEIFNASIEKFCHLKSECSQKQKMHLLVAARACVCTHSMHVDTHMGYRCPYVSACVSCSYFRFIHSYIQHNLPGTNTVLYRRQKKWIRNTVPLRLRGLEKEGNNK